LYIAHVNIRIPDGHAQVCLEILKYGLQLHMHATYKIEKWVKKAIAFSIVPGVIG